MLGTTHVVLKVSRNLPVVEAAGTSEPESPLGSEWAAGRALKAGMLSLYRHVGNQGGNLGVVLKLCRAKGLPMTTLTSVC